MKNLLIGNTMISSLCSTRGGWRFLAHEDDFGGSEFFKIEVS